MLDSLMHDDWTGLHAVASNGSKGLAREWIGDGGCVDDHGTRFAGNTEQVDTCSNRNQVCSRGTARHEYEITGTSSSKRCPGSVRGSIEDGDIGSTILCRCQYGFQASRWCTRYDRSLRFP